MIAFLKHAWASLTNFNFYYDVADFVLKPCLKYFFLLVFLFSFVFVLIKGQAVLDMTYLAIKQELGAIPEIVIEKGVLSAKVDQPYIKKLFDLFFIIDTTGQHQDLGDEYPAGILLKKDGILVKRNPKNKKLHDISKVGYFILNEKQILKWKDVAFLILLPVLLGGYFFYHSLSLAFYFTIFSLVGFLISSALQINLRLNQIINLAIYALTPYLIVRLFVCKIEGLFLTILANLIFLAYFSLAIYVNKERKVL